MPQPKKGARLGGSPAHQKLILANLATSLFEHGKITTTEAKARMLRPYAERREVRLVGEITPEAYRVLRERDRGLAEPQLRTTRPPSSTAPGPWFATTAHGPDLFAASQQAVRHMIDHLVRERGLSREEAYILCSVTVDLKISEIVDAPNWIVSAFLPEGVFVG